jgi:hypothetical protein
MPTFLQWWGIMGEVVVLEMLLTRSFCEDFRKHVRPHQHNEQLSDRQVYFFVSVSFVLVAATWPVFIVRNWFFK